LNYVGCSPKRVPVARLAAAQAALDGASPKNSKVTGEQAKIKPQT